MNVLVLMLHSQVKRKDFRPIWPKITDQDDLLKRCRKGVHNNNKTTSAKG